MSVCIINEKEYEIEIAKTPFATKWLKLFNNKLLTFYLNKIKD